jgi:uncharacterized protein YcfJ
MTAWHRCTCGTPPGYCYGCSPFGFDPSPKGAPVRAAVRGAMIGSVVGAMLGGPTGLVWGALFSAMLNGFFGESIDRKLRAS